MDLDFFFNKSSNCKEADFVLLISSEYQVSCWSLCVHIRYHEVLTVNIINLDFYLIWQHFVCIIFLLPNWPKNILGEISRNCKTVFCFMFWHSYAKDRQILRVDICNRRTAGSPYYNQLLTGLHQKRKWMGIFSCGAFRDKSRLLRSRN